MATHRPVPVPTSVTQEYWQYLRDGELRLPFCRSCSNYHFYPHPVCPMCMSRSLEYRPTSGVGTIYSSTVVRSAQPPFRGHEPYVVAIVELDEGVRMVANIVTDDPDAVKIGMRVRLTFEQLTPDISLPQFEPA